MSDYTEHLISMAGGDGEADVLGEIEARIPQIPESEMSRAERDRAALLAMVREQQAALSLIANQVNASEMLCRMNGRDPELASVPAVAIRDVLATMDPS